MAANQFTVFTEGDALYGDMLGSIRNARQSIVMETYIFAPDEVGLRFIDALIERANAGVKVRLHLDTFGSAELLIGSQDSRLSEAGVELKWFNALWYLPHRFNRRNHRKLLVVDDETAWLGGFNIHRENSLQVYGEGRWRDTQVRIDGPLAGLAREYFDKLWRGRRRWKPVFNPEAESTLVSNHNWFQRHRLRRLLAHQFHKARERVLLCTPYFMPDNFTRRHMVMAAKRGVRVQLLLPAVSDRPVVQWVARAAYASLMWNGVKIFEYEPRVLHAKIIIIDDTWCTVGSANIDYRSFFINYELNLVSIRKDLIDQLEKNYKDDLSMSREIMPANRQRHSWIQYFYQLIGWVGQRIL
jgi:cardiolipin synthase